MVERSILISNYDDAIKFSDIVSSHSFDTELVSGKYTVNAKSIMGIFSLDLTKPVKMVSHCEEDDSILSEVEQYLYIEEK